MCQGFTTLQYLTGKQGTENIRGDKIDICTPEHLIQDHGGLEGVSSYLTSPGGPFPGAAISPETVRALTASTTGAFRAEVQASPHPEEAGMAL